MSMDKVFDSVVALIKDASIESVVRWAAAVHNFIAPGYMLIFAFRSDVFAIGVMKLVLLSFFVSAPITYVCYLFWGNKIARAAEEGSDKTVQRIRILVFSTATIFTFNFVLAIYALFLGGG